MEKQEHVKLPDNDELFTSMDTRGTEILLGDLPVYTVGEGPKCIIFAYDVYGSQGGRTRFICDYIALAGYRVLLPDFFRNTAWEAGKPFDEDFHFWIKLHGKHAVREDVLGKLLPYAREHGATQVAVLGVHWGAFPLFSVCSEPGFSCGVSVDPDIHLGVEFPQQELELYRSVRCPQLIIAAQDNRMLQHNGGEAVEALQKQLGADFKLLAVPSTKFGFFSAQHMGDEAHRAAIRETLQSALDFIAAHK